MNILHLEDDGPLRDILKIALSSADPTLKIHQFINSSYALNYAKEHVSEIDLYILDIRVPGEYDGLEFAEQVRALGSTSRIVMTSAYRRPDQERLTTINAEWMAKPWHVMEAPNLLLGMNKKSRKRNLKAWSNL